MRRLGWLLVGLLIGLAATSAFAQEPDPRKSQRLPWPIDQRCAVMSAHIYNQGTLTSVCLPQEAARTFINPSVGYVPSQSQTLAQESVRQARPPRQDEPRGD